MKTIYSFTLVLLLLISSTALAKPCTESEITYATHADFVEWFTHKYGFSKCVDVKLPVGKKGEECEARIQIKLGGMSDIDEVYPPDYKVETCDKPASAY